MNLDLVFLAGLLAFVMFVGCAFLFQRWQWRRRKRLGQVRFGFYPRTGSMGNALHQLQTVVEPQMRYVIEEKLNEETEDDATDGVVDPEEYLLRQARRIQRGETLDRITALRR